MHTNLIVENVSTCYFHYIHSFSNRTSREMELLNVSSITHDESSPLGDKRVVTWILGLTFVTIINLSSILGALIVPFWTPGDNSVRRDPLNGDEISKEQLFATSRLHNGLEGLAFGSLLASSIFHLIPHAFDLIGQGEKKKTLLMSSHACGYKFIICLINR